LRPENAIPENRNYLRIQYGEVGGVQTIKEKYYILLMEIITKDK
jgi:hypothetical protein